jgi:hypothetical protein
MANVTVSPGREGPIDVFVELEDVNEQPLAVGPCRLPCPTLSGESPR